MTSKPSRYNNFQIILHWLTAILILFTLFIGQFVLEQTPNSDPIKVDGLRGHMIIGSVIIIIVIVRVILAEVSAQPPHATTGRKFLDKLGVVAHYSLNILALLVAFSGIGIAVQADLFAIVFGGQGALPKDFFEFPLRLAHGVLTKLLGALIFLHVVGALYHQFHLKDQLFRRMWFGKSENN